MFTKEEVGLILPDALSDKEVMEANKISSINAGNRTYEYKGLKFNIDNNVFKPGGTSRVIHDFIYDKLDLKDKKICIMGVGCGVETIICSKKGAREIIASDIHKESVEYSKNNYIKFFGPQKNSTFIISDLFENYNSNLEVDYIFFNTPVVKVKYSSDKHTIRNVCTGAEILERFFVQINDKNILNHGGSIFIVVSNTSNQKEIIENIYKQGFFVQEYTKYEWEKPYEKVKTFLLEIKKKLNRLI